MRMTVEDELSDLAVPGPRLAETAIAPDLLEAELFGLEETLNILRDEFTSVAPRERTHVARHIRDTRLRIARIRVQLSNGR